MPSDPPETNLSVASDPYENAFPLMPPINVAHSVTVVQGETNRHEQTEWVASA